MIIMPKKNTSIYLDKDLVRYAKKHNINISQLTENAIKQELFHLLSTGEKALIDIKSYLELLKTNRQCYFLPLELSGIEINNVANFDKFPAKFNQYNVIVGPYESGKTMLIRIIAYALSLDDFPIRNLLGPNKGDGYIRISVNNTKKLISRISIINEQDTLKNGRTRCILLDDVFDGIDLEKCLHFNDIKYQSMLTNFKEFLCNLREYNIQIILTTSFTDEKVYDFYSTIFPKCNFINLKRSNR